MHVRYDAGTVRYVRYGAVRYSTVHGRYGTVRCGAVVRARYGTVRWLLSNSPVKADSSSAFPKVFVVVTLHQRQNVGGDRRYPARSFSERCVVWCGVVWCGVVCAVRCGVVWCGAVWCSMVWFMCENKVTEQARVFGWVVGVLRARLAFGEKGGKRVVNNNNDKNDQERQERQHDTDNDDNGGVNLIYLPAPIKFSTSYASIWAIRSGPSVSADHLRGGWVGVCGCGWAGVGAGAGAGAGAGVS